MGNNNKSTNNSSNQGSVESTLAADFKKNNKEVYQQLLETNKRLSNTAKTKLKEILNFCNRNNLELTTIKDEYYYNQQATTPTLTIINHETGKRINLFDDMLKGEGLRVLDTKKFKYINDTLNELPPNYMKTVKDVNILYGDPEDAYMGYFTPLSNHSINLTAGIFGVTQNRSPKQSELKFKKAIVHEMGHAYDYNEIGHGLFDQNKVFSQYDNSNESPTYYSQTTASETISTTLEQVYTQSLRSDAQMRNGSKPSSYQEWAEDWSDIVSEAEHILYG